MISYGFQKTTFHYLVFYGFVPTGYQHGDYVTINLIPVPAPAPIPYAYPRATRHDPLSIASRPLPTLKFGFDGLAASSALAVLDLDCCV